ncbi:VanW family protein [Mesobacillus jeotgali]|uniref:VanW family protein n=1 Tax=Mesobacillus jeotgali TaxID=129985 RepID=A0ABY9VGB0_9BACI|nr:VanW family protein [Mesobacillus jeotgali]WNF21891.1 VanW family protein [Mesobacillus jeotgali]
MKKQQIVKFSLILSVLSIFIFSFTYFGSDIFSARTSAKQAFSENTTIGNFDVSNKSQDEATTYIQTQVDSWLAEANIRLVYKGQNYPVNTDSFVFGVEDSISSATSGAPNELYVHWEGETINNLNLPSSIVPKLDTEKLTIEMQASAQKLIPEIAVKLEDFLPTEDPVIISTALVKLTSDAESENIEKLVEIEILPDSMFSLAGYANENGLANVSASTFSQIGSALYKALLQSDISIVERHLSSQLPKNIELGYETKVDFSENLDLKFYNPNGTSYKVEWNLHGQELEAVVTGALPMYEYKITATDKQEFKPRIIKQYSPLLKQGQKSVQTEGKAGLMIKINREIYGENGELLKTEFISEDFYPPSHRVEVLPLAPAVIQTVPDSTTGSDNVTVPGVDQNDSNPGQPSGTNPTVPSNDGEQQQPVDKRANDEQDTDDGGLWGKPNEQPK